MVLTPIIRKVVDLNKTTGTTDGQGNPVQRKVYEYTETEVVEKVVEVNVEVFARTREEKVAQIALLNQEIADIDQMLAGMDAI